MHTHTKEKKKIEITTLLSKQDRDRTLEVYKNEMLISIKLDILQHCVHARINLEAW
jgi:hypothetical protein